MVSGAVTTCGAAAFLLFGQISVFRKFSAILIVTISFSIFVSLFFFPALCHVMGPEGHCGDVDHHLIKPLKDRCCLNRSLQNGQKTYRKGKKPNGTRTSMNTSRVNTSNASQYHNTTGPGGLSRRSRVY